MQQIYNEFGFEVMEEDGRFYMKYDAGEIIIRPQTIEITKEEAEQIIQEKDSDGLYDYIIKNLNDRMY
jgi:hypothetical protein